VKRLAKTGGILIVMVAAAIGVLWLLKDRISGPAPAPVAPDEAPGFRVAPHPPIDVTATATSTPPDDLADIKGIGPVFRARLADEGITTFAGLAAGESARLADAIGASEAQLADWASQATELAG